MSYQVCHMEKLKRTDVRGILEHLTHNKVSSKNGDIDKSLTKTNIDLVTWRYMPSESQRCGLWRKTTDQRLDTVIEQKRTSKKALRKDATFVCSFVLGSDHNKMVEMDVKTQRAYFKDCYEFFCRRYGKENVLFAVVHNDELTPNLHLGVIPLTKDGRLSAKTLFDRKELRSLQTDLAKEVGSKYGLERGKEGSKKAHISEQDYKFNQQYELNQALEKEIKRQKKELSIVKQEIGLNQKERYMIDELSFNHSELYRRLQTQFYNSPKGKAFKDQEQKQLENERDDDFEKTL